MNAVVVYESLWGNTAAIARAIAEGLGPDARALTTDEATPEVIADADLIVAGAPLLAFSLPTDRVRESIATGEKNAPARPDLSHPSMRTWLAALPHGRGRSAAFETRFKWSPGSATGAIVDGLKDAGYQPVTKARKFLVTGKYGPLLEGEADRARRWGEELAHTMAADPANRPDQRIPVS